MKKFTITMIIIASILVIIGIGMIVVSSAFFQWPWNDNFCQEIQKTYWNNGAIVQKTIEASPATLKIIDISIRNGKIEVIKGGDQVVITYPENSNNSYEIIKTRDKVLINEESKNNYWPFNNRFRFRHDQDLVLIKIPHKWKLKTLNLNTLNGKIITEAVMIENANLRVNNGTIKLTNTQIDQVIATSANGNCNSTGCIIKEMDFRTINGLVSVENGDVAKIKFHAVNGKVKVTRLPGKAADYNINCRTVNGTVHINGKRVSSRGSYKSVASGYRSIDVDTVNGNIKIDTLIK